MSRYERFSSQRTPCCFGPLLFVALLAAALCLSPAAWAQSSGGNGGSSGSTAGQNGTADWNQVGTALGMRGTLRKSGVFKVSFSRQIAISVQGQSLQPSMAAEGYLAFFIPQTSGSTATSTSGSSPRALITGELPLLEQEVGDFTRSMDAARMPFMFVPALHNHELMEQPTLIFVHFEGYANPLYFAKVLRSALDRTSGGFQEDLGNGTAASTGVNVAQIKNIFGTKAEARVDNGVLSIMMLRPEPFGTCAVAVANGKSSSNGSNGSGSNGSSGTSSNGNSGAGSSFGGALGQAFSSCQMGFLQSGVNGSNGTNGVNGTSGSNGTSGNNSASTVVALPPIMGAFNEIRIQSTGTGQARVNAEFALLGTEIPATERALLRGGFDISAVHNHLVNVVPSLYYIHASATGNPVALSQTLRKILDQNAAAAGTATGMTTK